MKVSELFVGRRGKLTSILSLCFFTEDSAATAVVNGKNKLVKSRVGGWVKHSVQNTSCVKEIFSKLKLCNCYSGLRTHVDHAVMSNSRHQSLETAKGRLFLESGKIRERQRETVRDSAQITCSFCSFHLQNEDLLIFLGLAWLIVSLFGSYLLVAHLGLFTMARLKNLEKSEQYEFSSSDDVFRQN